ncbi:MAG: ABC transporter permease [Deltaproteobacteria bacterium]|nr:ABC transporter permease [Deltaproteobacteria bacterium]MBW1871814.1 ABC transporter permease [Deltaproteobacteria bacterium]
MNFTEQMRVSVDSIRANKMRSFLTTLGVIIGVASVILLVSIGEGMRTYLADIFAGMGSNLLFVFPGKSDTRGHGRSLSSVRKITLDDARALEQRSLNIVGISPLVVGGGTVERGSISRDVLVMGTNEEFPKVHNQGVSTGFFIRKEDVTNKHRVAVIGKTVATELFGDRSPLGQPIKISESRYRVVGIMEPKGQSLGFDFDDMVYVPVTCALDLFNQEGLTRLSIKAANKSNLEPAIMDIKRLLTHRHNNKEDFTIVSQADLLDTFNQIAETMTFVLLGIASISLLVGGIGIMNIMLVSVRERTREIGVRKAVGARKRDILMQFLVESVTVSLLGGAIGLGLGALIAAGVSWAVPEIPTKITLWIVLTAFGFSVAVGVFFGVAPARKAAQLDPIESLRYE